MSHELNETEWEFPPMKEGDLLQDFSGPLAEGYHLVVMPVARLTLDFAPCEFPGEIIFYPKGMPDLVSLNIHENRRDSINRAESISATTGINEELLGLHTLVAFPMRFEWRDFRTTHFRSNDEFIRFLSSYVDKTCFDFIKYKQCALFTNGDPIHCVPGRPGQIDANHMMSGALLYNHTERKSYIIAGDAFTHIITRGLGLPLEDINHDEFPKDGEVGRLVRHSLLLYASMLEAHSPTSQFVQAIGMLEFLASPDKYMNFKKIKRVIARYVAKSPKEYDLLLDRFNELTGKTDEATETVTGYRTQLVHLGKRLEDILPEHDRRLSLMVELDGYIRSVIDHMIYHSDLTLAQYEIERSKLTAWKPL